jgi:hypothetical protein
MIGCLIMYHKGITNVTKRQIFHAMFKVKEMKVEDDDEDTIVGYIFQASQLIIWQAALELECAEIMVGYGVGASEEEAKAKAYRILVKRISTMIETNVISKEVEIPV